MKRLDIPIIALDRQGGESHSCEGRCTGKGRGDGYCYHDGGTRHPIGQCRGHHAKPAATVQAKRPS